MGLDLTLVADGHGEGIPRTVEEVHSVFGSFFGYTRIRLSRCGALFEAWGGRGAATLVKLDDLPTELEWFGYDGIKTVSHDARGEKLQYALAGDLIAAYDALAAEHPEMRLSNVNVGAIGWLRALYPTTPIVLWWH